MIVYFSKGTKLKVLFPNMLHVTCLAHALNRLSDRVREQFTLLDQFIATTKMVFLKAPSRIEIFRQIAGNIALPPAPIITRWSTWLRAVLYYKEHYDVLVEVIHAIPNDAKRVDDLKKLVDDHSRYIKADIAFIDANYSFIIEKINIFEQRNILLADSIRHLDETIERVGSVLCDVGVIIRNHFEKTLRKNPDLSKIRQINSIMQSTTADFELPVRLEHVTYYRVCNLTSVDTERCFSRYKLLVNDRRHFKFENLTKYFFINCNAFINE